MRQRGTILVIAGEIEAVGVDLSRIVRLAANQIAHLRVGLGVLSGAPEIAGEAVGDPDAVRIARQPTALNFCRLRPAPLVLQGFSLLRQPVVGKTALNVIHAAALAGRERGNPGGGFFRRLLAIEISQAANRVAVAAVHAQRLLIVAFGGGAVLAGHGGVPQAQHRVAVGVIHRARLLVKSFRLRGIIGLQRGVTLLDQQPVAVSLQKAVPLAAVAALRRKGNGFL